MDTRFEGQPSSFYCVALNLALHEIGSGPTADLIKHALDNPGPDAIKAVLAAGVGEPWCIRVKDALVVVGIAATSFLECRS